MCGFIFRAIHGLSSNCKMWLSECSWSESGSEGVRRTGRNVGDQAAENRQRNRCVDREFMDSNDTNRVEAWQQCGLQAQACPQDPSLCQEWTESRIVTRGKNYAPPVPSTANSRHLADTFAAFLTVAGNFSSLFFVWLVLFNLVFCSAKRLWCVDVTFCLSLPQLTVW